jgi:hypothetical protein
MGIQLLADKIPNVLYVQCGFRKIELNQEGSLVVAFGEKNSAETPRSYNSHNRVSMEIEPLFPM